MGLHRTPLVSTALGLLVAVEAVSFLLFGAGHLGRPLVLGPLRLEEPNVPLATVVELVSGAALLGAAHSLLSGSSLRWRTASRAHALALAGVVFLGAGALALDLGPRTAASDAYRRGMGTLLSAGLLLSLAARWRESRRRRPRLRRATV